MLSAENLLRWTVAYPMTTLRVLAWLHAETVRLLDEVPGSEGWTAPLSQRDILTQAGVSRSKSSQIFQAVAAEAELSSPQGSKRCYRLLGASSVSQSETDDLPPGDSQSETLSPLHPPGGSQCETATPKCLTIGDSW
jgi:hypothetical protein